MKSDFELILIVDNADGLLSLKTTCEFQLLLYDSFLCLSIVLTELQAFLTTRCSAIILILVSVYQTKESKDNLLSLKTAQSLGAADSSIYLLFLY